MLYLNVQPKLNKSKSYSALHVQMLYLNKREFAALKLGKGSTCTNVVFKSHIFN